MKTIEKIKVKLEKYPQLTFQIDGNRISIDSPAEDGFCVWLTVNDPGFTVGYDGWHEEFDDETEALDAVAFGLSDSCRLKVIKRGNTECSWTVEGREGGEWQGDSSTGLLLVPFWQRQSVEYRRNPVIKSGITHRGTMTKQKILVYRKRFQCQSCGTFFQGFAQVPDEGFGYAAQLYECSGCHAVFSHSLEDAHYLGPPEERMTGQACPDCGLSLEEGLEKRSCVGVCPSCGDRNYRGTDHAEEAYVEAYQLYR